MTSVDIQQQERTSAALPPAAAGLRERAQREFSGIGYPTTRLEDWKYTSLRAIAEGRFAVGVDPARRGTAALDNAARAILAEELGDSIGLVFVDGAPAADFAAPSIGGLVRSLGEAVAEDAAAVEKAIAAVAAIDRSSLVTLNTAFLGTGTFIRIPDETVVEEPIHLLYATSPGGEARAHHLRNLITVGRNSRVTVIEHYLNLGASDHWTNSATDITLGDGAKLRHYKIQRESLGAYHTADIAALQGRDSSWHSVSLSLGARLCRNDIRARLAAPGAHCSFDGLYMADGDQHVDHHTLIDHAAPHCTSEELYKGILGGRAVGVFNGKVLVRNEAQRTDARQLNKNLLLSDAATINTKPQLEIFADDVKCSHGATTGRLDEDAIFFLRARGLDEAAARSLLTYAFGNEIVERIDAGSVRDRLESVVRERLDTIVDAGEAA